MLVYVLGRASGRHLHALAPATRPARRADEAGGAARSSRARSASRPDRSRDRHDRRRARRPRRPPAAKGERVCRTVVLRLRFADFTRRLGRHALPGDRADGTILDAARGLLAASTPTIEAQASRSSGSRSRTSRTSAGSSSLLSFDAVRRNRRRARRRARSVQVGRSRAPCSSAAIRRRRARAPGLSGLERWDVLVPPQDVRQVEAGLQRAQACERLVAEGRRTRSSGSSACM